MSREKHSISEVKSVVERAMHVFGCKKKKDLAKLFGILPQDMTGRVKRGTIINLIEKEAYKRNVNFNYILTGEGDKGQEQDKESVPTTEIDLEEKVKQLEARIIILERLLSQSKSNPGRRWYDDVIGKKSR